MQLFWKDQHVADIENAGWADFPWASGKLVRVNLSPPLRQALEWLAEVAEAEELEDPPFDEELFDHWFVVSPTGEKLAVSPPLVDFEIGAVEWR
ncbi:MAG: hypothetical protein K0Q72_5177 [Armatimonadetes bacterium]|jgi:hypothetical protein|nr:hypothetical protein [Armatimonadota bacterium]